MAKTQGGGSERSGCQIGALAYEQRSGFRDRQALHSSIRRMSFYLMLHCLCACLFFLGYILELILPTSVPLLVNCRLPCKS